MRRKVLVLDDSLTVRMDLSDALADAGFEPRPCATAGEARQVLADEAVDAVVVDVLLPDADGIEFIAELRGDERTAALPALVLSSEADVKDRIRGLTGGADEYVGKPYDLAYVIAKIRELVRHHGEAATPASSTTTVLVIDDSATFRGVLRSACEEVGYRVLVAASGEEGLRLAAAEHPDGMIVDGALPDLDGASVIRRVRLDEALRGIACLLLTGSDERAAELHALESGADAFVRKGEDVAVVLAKLAAALRRSTHLGADDRVSLAAPRKILVVGDHTPALPGLAAALRDEGNEVVLAHTGEEALELLAVEAVDCVLVDLQLPGLSGQETCRRAKSAPQVRDVPLIALTPADDRDAMLSALAAGADDCIADASDVELVSARVRAQLRRKQFEDEARRARDVLLRKELEAADARAARELAESRAAAEAEVRRSQAFLDTIVRNIPDMIVVKDAETLVIEAINPAGASLLGREVGEVVGRREEDLLPPAEARASAASDAEALARGSMVDIEAEVVRGGPRGERVLHTKRIPITGPDGRRYLLRISEDVTERHRAEEQLQRAKELAERANAAKSEFLSRMSHELRTPLNAVLGFAQLLELDDLAPSQLESLEQIVRAGTHLLGLINEVLDLSRIEAGELSLSLEPVLVSSVVEQSLDLVRTQAAARRIALPDGAPPGSHRHVRADEQRLKQVLVNLLGNAVKYNREGGSIELRCELTRPDVLRVSVRDTGPGIPPDKQRLLFSPFERLGAERTDIEGTGLGLALTHRLVEAMGGTISVDSAVGVGSTFSIELACADAGVPATPLRGAEGHVGLGDTVATVLLVEDNLANARLVERALRLRPYVTLLLAEEGETGIELAIAHQPDLVLLDLHLPDLHGEQVLQRLRAEPRTAGTTVVVLSADATPGVVERLTASGADGYLTKPFQLAELLGVVDGRVGASRLRQRH